MLPNGASLFPFIDLQLIGVDVADDAKFKSRHLLTLYLPMSWVETFDLSNLHSIKIVSLLCSEVNIFCLKVSSNFSNLNSLAPE